MMGKIFKKGYQIKFSASPEREPLFFGFAVMGKTLNFYLSESLEKEARQHLNVAFRFAELRITSSAHKRRPRGPDGYHAPRQHYSDKDIERPHIHILFKEDITPESLSDYFSRVIEALNRMLSEKEVPEKYASLYQRAGELMAHIVEDFPAAFAQFLEEDPSYWQAWKETHTVDPVSRLGYLFTKAALSRRNPDVFPFDYNEETYKKLQETVGRSPELLQCLKDLEEALPEAMAAESETHRAMFAFGQS